MPRQGCPGVVSRESQSGLVVAAVEAYGVVDGYANCSLMRPLLRDIAIVRLLRHSVRGIHGGKTGDADNLTLMENYVAIGWDRMGDLSKLTADREAFTVRVAEVYLEKKPSAIPNIEGQIVDGVFDYFSSVERPR